MKRFLPIIGTVLLVAAAGCATKARPPATTPGVKTANSEAVQATPVPKTGTVAQKIPSGAEILSEMKRTPPRERAGAKAKLEQTKQQFAMIKALSATKPLDPAQTVPLALAEEAVDDMIELYTLLDQADADIAVGNRKKAEQTYQVAEAKADEFSKLQERMAKTMPVKRHPVEKPAPCPATNAVPEPAPSVKQ